MTLSYNPKTLLAGLRSEAAAQNRSGELGALLYYLKSSKYDGGWSDEEVEGWIIEDVADWLYGRRRLCDVTRSFDI